MGELLVRTIISGARALGVALPDGAPRLFDAYYALTEEKSAVMNLTAIRGEADAARLHFLDSAALLAAPGLRGAALAGKRLLDVGSGAGFPGMALAIARPELSVTLLDAREKRVDFLRGAAAALGLTNVVCVCARAEDFINDYIDTARTPRASYDIVTARGVARLALLCELCMPFLTPGGVLIAPKGADAAAELAEARRAIASLGGELEALWEYDLPDAAPPDNSDNDNDIDSGSPRRAAVVIRQTEPSPARFPRRWAAMQRKPL